MSGRDMRNFVTNHRNGETDKLVQRVKDGLYSSKYKDVDYAKLRAIAAEKKFKGQEKLVKVKKLQEASSQGKEHNLVKQHQMVWKRESSRIKSMKNHLQADIDNHVRLNADSELLGHIYTDFEGFSYKLERDQTNFKGGTTTAIWNLRDDLKLWLEEQSSHGAVATADPQTVQNAINSVKAQQHTVMEKLHNEQCILEDELCIGDLPTFGRMPPERSIQTGIPEEAFDLECPDFDLKSSVLQEFIVLDQKYIERLDELEEIHCDAIESSTGHWRETDHFTFVYVVDQYTHDVPNRRKLYIDRLKRHLPHMTRSQIVAHEEWWILYKYYFERCKDLISDWLRDRTELLNRTKVVFSEVVAELELAAQKEENREKQKQFCDVLYAKVQKWREQKMEVMALEQQCLEQRHQEYLQVLCHEEQKEKAKRKLDKEKISAYHKEQEDIRGQQEEWNRQRLQVLKEQLRQQAEYDSQRVSYRKAMLVKEKENNARLVAEKLKAEEHQQEVLERLREKVRPHVDADLKRLWSDTESWQARLKGEEEFINIQRPLFEINTFTSKKVAADPRFRLAERLHEAGLTKTNYGGQIMSTLQPLQPPRRDMKSTVFK